MEIYFPCELSLKTGSNWKTAERVIPQTVKGEREIFLQHYRALYAQLREGDWLYFLAEMRKSEQNSKGIPVLTIVLNTSGGEEKRSRANFASYRIIGRKVIGSL